MRDHYDVLIVGGGLVGASLAAALAPTALDIGVVEAVAFTRNAPPSYDDRTLALSYGSRRIFEGVGVWAAIAALGAAPIKHIHVSDRGRFGVTRLAANDAGLEALGYVVTHRALGAALLDAVDRRPNVDWISPASVQSVALEDSCARLRVRTAAAERQLTTRLLVAADGANSPVREAVGMATERVEYRQTAVVSAVSTEHRPGDTAYERFTESGPLALLPADAERYAIVWTVPSDRVDSVLSSDDDSFRAQLQDCFGERLGRFTRVGRRYAHPLALTRISEHVRPRLVVIGNAAHTLHPVAGQGFNLGLRDVATLAQVIADGVATQTDPGDLALLRRYADARARDNRIMSTFTHALVRLFSNDFPPLAVGRNLGLLAVDLAPPVKRRLIRLTSGLSGRLPRLARGVELNAP